MVQEKKSRPSLWATITVSAITGALIGYLVSSGIEDISHEISKLPETSINLPPYMKTILSGICAVGRSVLGTLQFFNKDEHNKSLVMHVIEKQETEKSRVKPKPNLEGLAHAFENVTEGIHNKNLANSLYSTIAQNIQKSPLRNAKLNYELNRNGFLASSFEVFVPFSYNERTIDPKSTLDEFFDKEEHLYKMIIEELSKSAERFVSGKSASNNTLPKGFKELLSEEMLLAQDIALWATYLSKRSGIVGSQVKEKFTQMGIENPNYLAQDVKIIGQNILNLYNSK